MRHRQGRLIGRMEALGFPLQQEAVLKTLTEDVLKSSEIEGEILDRDQVRSSIARRLGMDIGALTPADRNVEGVVEMMLDATQKLRAAADRGTPVRLARRAVSDRPQRHDTRSPSAPGATTATGRCRSSPGRSARRACTTRRRPAERARRGNEGVPRVVQRGGRASIRCSRPASRISGSSPSIRSTTATAASRAPSPTWRSRARKDSPQRFYSMSAQIRQERNAYYDMLEATQKGDLDITPWLEWFLACLDRAFDGAETRSPPCFAKPNSGRSTLSRFNDRQRDILNRLLDGFEGKLTSSKWAKIEKCSPDTALRDIRTSLSAGSSPRTKAAAEARAIRLPREDLWVRPTVVYTERAERSELSPRGKPTEMSEENTIVARRLPDGSIVQLLPDGSTRPFPPDRMD